MTQQTSINDDTPLVSVVVPTYNCAPYLARALHSVLDQTYPNLECIVIDDGSTDDTPQILEAFGSRIHAIKQANAGASAARNAGIEAARGAYIAFLDADDYWLPTKIANQLEVFRKHPGLVLVSCDFTWATSAEPATPAPPPYDVGPVRVFSTLTQLLRNPYLGTPTVVVDSRAAKQVGGFDTNLPVGEDVDFYFRLCAGRMYARLDQPLAVFQRRPGSLTTHIRGYSDNLEVLDRAERLLSDPTAEDYALLTSLRLEVYQNWIAALLNRGTGKEVRKILKQSRQTGRLSGYHIYYLKSLIIPALPALRSLRKMIMNSPAEGREASNERGPI